MKEHPIKIMMVDDEPRFRETTEKILAKKGFETLIAADGAQALAKLSQNPDVVVLDIRMPGMDGHEVLVRIKARCPDLPVIMLTGHGDMPSAEKALENGAFDYLSKPCDIDLLAEKIRDAWHRGRNNGPVRERTVAAIMIPLQAYTTVKDTATVAQAVFALKKSFIFLTATNRLMETGHRSVLVQDPKGEISGILTIQDLLSALLPEYLSAPKPSLADSMVHSPMFWHGLFSARTGQVRSRPIREIMSPSPVSIGPEANLMAAAHLMMSRNQRRLMVSDQGIPKGIVREQDLFFELERMINDSDRRKSRS